MSSQVDAFSLEGEELPGLPAMGLPGYKLPKYDLPKGMNQSELGRLGGALPQAPSLQTGLGDVGAISDKAAGISEDVKAISEGNLNDVKQLPQTLEQQASKVEGIAELQKQNGVVTEYTENIAQLQDPEAMKQLAAQEAKKVAIDHFAGKEEVLQKAMDEMSKYKRKYEQFSGVKDKSNRFRNAMKTKPLIERFFPGVYLQYQASSDRLFDINPYINYRVSGQFIAGLGWNERFGYQGSSGAWNATSRLYGPRGLFGINLARGFIAQLEFEYMRTTVPFRVNQNTGETSRDWVFGFAAGLKKDYRIYKNLYGTVLIQYNLYNPRFRSSYVDRLNSRIGFEYKLQKAKKSIK